MLSLIPGVPGKISGTCKHVDRINDVSKKNPAPFFKKNISKMVADKGVEESSHTFFSLLKDKKNFNLETGYQMAAG